MTKSNVSAFMVFERMTADNNNSLKFAPLDNISNMVRTKHGINVTIGVGDGAFMEKVMEGKLVGGFIFCDRDEFRRVQRQIESENGQVKADANVEVQP
jgi:hypothetical protein